MPNQSISPLSPTSDISEKLIRHMQEVSRLALAEKIEGLFDYVVDAVYDLTGMVTVLWLLDDVNSCLKIKAHRGLDEDYAQKAETPLEGSVTGYALHSRMPVCRPDIQNDNEEPKFYNLKEAQKAGWRYFVCVPLLGSEDEALGSLSIYGPDSKDCDFLQINYLQIFANQISTAVQNARLIERKERRRLRIRNVISAINDINSAIVENSRDGVMELITNKIRELTGASYASLRMKSENGKCLNPIATSGRDKDSYETLPIDNNSICGQVAQRGKAIINSDEKPYMCVPLKSNNEVIGTMYVESTKAGEFSSQFQIDFLQSLANQASIAIALGEELRQKNRQLEQANRQLEMKAESLDENLRQTVNDLKIMQTFSGQLNQGLN